MKLSVLLITYNHALHIVQCLDSILMQQTTFDVEVIVADDFSTDDTVSLIKEHLQRSPLSPYKFIFLRSEKNLGFVKNYQRAFNACEGEYIAVMEGDDYWTDPKRLLKHVDFLENHRECVLSMNRFIMYNEVTHTYIFREWNSAVEFEYLTTQALILENKLGNLSACVFRKSDLVKLKPDFFDLEIADWMIGIVLSQYGLIALLKETMSLYRMHSEGQWSRLNEKEKLDKMNEVIDSYDKYLGYRFSHEFTLHKSRINQEPEPTRVQYHFRDFIPPIIIYILKLLVPNVISRYFKK